ncbi:Hsp20/alpha crystallin family protein [Flavihumibacter fluvii]|uniref:Hsp20/alpha crystallin family protein n=1 Tax=Flavihumibacter fluvii TaxID=2838157 RepID=UPI001BDF486B|nr:Hsp20/alpha crystallin family protein [Flavihumibacter fluvii]ULQ52694.1 Hsp20/alpha crystallin family protein [Flavihumibacter fluvii]
MANLTTGKLPISRPWSDWLDVDRIFNDNFLTEFNKKMPAINVAETDKAYQIEVVAPGFLKTDFTVKLDGDMLQISAESTTETKGEEKNYTRKEYHRNSFNRSFTLPENVQADAINAQYEDGILTLTIPKLAPQSKPAPKSINVL